MTHHAQNTPLRMLSLNSWIKAGAQCGVNALDVFDANGINIDLESFRRTLASPTQLLGVLTDCTQSATRSHFPLVLGEMLTFDQAPLAETFLATSPTLRDSLKLLDWAMRGFTHWFKVSLHEHEDEAWLIFTLPFSRSGEPPLRFVTEAAMRMLVRVGFELLGQSPQLRAVHFTHYKPIYHYAYRQHFPVEPRYQQTKNAVFFDRRLLDQPLTAARGALHQEAFQSLMRQWPADQEHVSFVQQVMDRLVYRPELLSGKLVAVAESFGMSPRTLQRRLNKEGQGFTEVLNLAQQTLATQWLSESTCDIQDISGRLGYQSRRAFTNAFKQWTGVTPSQYRARVKN